MHRLLNPRPHAFIDYAAIAVLALAPTLFGFEGLPSALCYGIAVAYLGLCLMTAYPLGAAKVIPFSVHGGIELAVGLFMLIAPFLLGFSDVPEARNFFIVSGIAVAAVWALTNYRAADLYRGRSAVGQRRHA